jgi:hypothetical protein
MPLRSQETFGQEVEALRAVSEQLIGHIQWVNNRVTNILVSFMNTTDVTVVIKSNREFSNSNCTVSVGIY